MTIKLRKAKGKMYREVMHFVLYMAFVINDKIGISVLAEVLT
jgi:hypothetical protein